MRIAIADDNRQDMEHLREELYKVFNELGYTMDNVRAFPSGESILNDFKEGIYDIIFLDIFMGGITGVVAAEKIREIDSKVSIIFTTTCNDYANQSYRLRASYYLLKPFGTEEVRQMIKMIDLHRFEAERTVEFPDGSRCRLHDIVYTEYSNHKITIHLTGGRTQSVWMSQTEMEELLCGLGAFFTCTKGILISLEQIQDLDEDCVKLCNGDVVPVSRARRPELKKAHAEFAIRSLRNRG